MVAAASTMKIGVPLACGATLRTASTKRRRTALSLASPFGATSILISPSGATQALLRSGGQGVERHRLGAEEIAHLLERRQQRRNQHALNFLRRRRRGLGEPGQSAGQPAGLSAAGLSTPAATLESSPAVLSIASSVSAGVGGGLSASGGHRVLKKEARVIDEGELLVLVLRDEVFDRARVRDLRQILAAPSPAFVA